MKHLNISMILIMLMSMVGIEAFAHDFEAPNADGVTIYYVKTSDTEVAVSFKGDYFYTYFNRYKGDVVIPESVTYDGITYTVTSIVTDAFSDCDDLTSVTIPNSVTSIGSPAFYHCDGLTSVTFHCKEIGDCFCSNSSIKEVIIGDEVTSIGERAFFGLKGLTSIEIPNSVTSIGSSAFSGCSGLTSIEIPNSVTIIGEYAFYSCSGLTSVTIPNSVTSIGNFAFSNCSGLTSVNVPVTDFSAFCNNQVVGLIPSKIGKPVYLIDKDGNEIKEYVIPEDVTTIGERAFFNCSGLTSVTIGNSVTSIGSDAFKGCDGINSVVFHCKETGSWFSGNSTIKEVIIGDEVTSIDNNAFKGCTGLTSLTIGNNVTTIGNQAFSGLSGLTSLTFHCKKIGHWFDYYGNPSIKEVIIGDEVTSIGEMAFYGFSGLTTIEIPNSVTSIGSSAFRSCSGLTSIEIPNNVTSIGDYAFEYCSGLTSVTIGNSVTSIGSDAFKGCDGINSVVFHCKEIGYWFSGFSSIKEVIIGDEVTSIGDWAFHGCSGLTDVFSYTKSVLSIGSVFGGYQNKATLHVPYALYEQYKESEYWKNFGKIVNFEGLYNVIYMVDSEEFKKSVVEYGTAITAEEEPTKEGYTFSGWSEIPETMPANDVTVTGTFTVNKYKLVYQVDGEEYKSSEIEYGTAITAEEEPTKEGYTFSGWSEIPETMPANDVIITGTFEKDIISGDANGDGVVNVTDIVEIVNDILGHPSAKFDPIAADVNGDGVVNVTDIVSVVNIILSSNARELTNRAAATNNLKLSGASIKLRDAENYTAAQFDIHLSDGSTINYLSLNSASDHQMTWKMVDANTCRVIVYSLSNAPFRAVKDELFNVTLSGNAMISNELLVNVDGMVTGINEMQFDKPVDVYDLRGNKIRSNTTDLNGLQKGVYIVNGKKTIVK
ncbi:MAG: leucine-rich repeat protein [Prevotella sp.]|nr:leucine-rich repeat protein [Prevotella sp.]